MPERAEKRELLLVLPDNEHVVGQSGEHLRAEVSQPSVAEHDDAIACA